MSWLIWALRNFPFPSKDRRGDNHANNIAQKTRTWTGHGGGTGGTVRRQGARPVAASYVPGPRQRADGHVSATHRERAVLLRRSAGRTNTQSCLPVPIQRCDQPRSCWTGKDHHGFARSLALIRTIGIFQQNRSGWRGGPTIIMKRNDRPAAVSGNRRTWLAPSGACLACHFGPGPRM